MQRRNFLKTAATGIATTTLTVGTSVAQPQTPTDDSESSPSKSLSIENIVSTAELAHQTDEEVISTFVEQHPELTTDEGTEYQGHIGEGHIGEGDSLVTVYPSGSLIVRGTSKDVLNDAYQTLHNRDSSLNNTERSIENVDVVNMFLTGEIEPVSLTDFQEYLQSSEDVDVTYEPTHLSALSYNPVDETGSILVFPSGTVSIMGVTSEYEAQQLYEMLQEDAATVRTN